MIFKGYIFGIAYALVCLLIALVVYKLGMPKAYSRKLVHILVGAEWIILRYYMGATYHFLIVCLFFLVLLTVAHFKKLMPMISSDSENAPGTVYYALAMSIMAVLSIFVEELMIPFGIGVMCTSVGDGLAGVVGQLIKKYNPKIYKNKSLFGALANFAVSSVTALVFDCVFSLPLNIWHCLAIGLLSVGLELITPFGLDNISITLGVAFFSYLLIFYPIIELFIFPIILTPFIIALVLQKKVLTPSALILALILDAVVSLTLCNDGFLILLAFLVGSVIVDKIKDRRKRIDDVTKKVGCRDGIQVIANGLVPMMFALLFSATYNPAFIVGYIAALNEAFADTCASGIGVFSDKVYDIFRRKRVKQGLSGGMTLIGTAAALAGSVIMAITVYLIGFRRIDLLLVVVAAGFLGTVFDSLLGSLLQVKYKCRVCGELTERDFHCKKLTEKHSGFEFFDNDVVNLFSGAFSAILATVICLLI